MNNRPSLRQIEAFLTVAATGSFSRAAERLRSTQPAVSQAVREMEEILSLRLFDRTTRRVDLTEAGTLLRDQLGQGVEMLDHAFGRARDMASLRQGHLRIAAPPLISASVLAPMLAGFARQTPGLTFELADMVAAEIPQRVRSGLADLGIGTFSPDEPGLQRRSLLSDAMALICPRGHPLALADARWADLAGVPLIALAQGSGLRTLMDEGFQAAGVQPTRLVTVQQVGTALSLVEAGMGVAVFPSYALRGREARLAAVALTDPTLRREIEVIQPPDRTATPAAAAFVRHLMHSFARAYRAPRPV